MTEKTALLVAINIIEDEKESFLNNLCGDKDDPYYKELDEAQKILKKMMSAQ